MFIKPPMDAFGILVERAEEMAAGFVQMLPQIAIAFFILLFTWGASALARSAANGITSRIGLRHRLRRLAVSFSGLLTWSCGILIALAVVVPGVEAGGLLAALGLASVAAAYIFDDLFQNFLAGVMMMLRKKLRIGDFIECGDIEGRVEQITARETYLRKLSNELVIVPNTFLFNNGVEIVTDQSRRRHEVTVRVGRCTNLQQVQAAVARAVRSVDQVDATRDVEVFACDLNDGSIKFTVRWWAGSKQIDMHRSRDAVIRAVKIALERQGVLIPLPQRTISFSQPPELRAVAGGLSLSPPR